MLLPILGVLALLAVLVCGIAIHRNTERQLVAEAQEIPATPIDWGAGSVLPSDGIRVEPLFPAHNVDTCTRCKHQAPGISAA